MKPIAVLLVAAGVLAGAAIWMFPSPRHAAGQDAPVFVTTIPSGYRDWRLVSVAREEPCGCGACWPAAENGDVDRFDRFARVVHDAINDPRGCLRPTFSVSRLSPSA